MLWLDNAQAVLKKVLKNGEPERIEEFVRLNNHYGFSIPSCDPARAMKKATKDPAGYYRRDVLIPGLQVDDLKAFNLHLLEQYGQDMLGPHYSR
jgi:transposase